MEKVYRWYLTKRLSCYTSVMIVIPKSLLDEVIERQNVHRHTGVKTVERKANISLKGEVLHRVTYNDGFWEYLTGAELNEILAGDATYRATIVDPYKPGRTPVWESGPITRKLATEARSEAINTAIAHIRACDDGAVAQYLLQEDADAIRISVVGTGEHVADLVLEKWS